MHMTFKSWSKIQHMSANNFLARGSNLTKLFHVTCLEAGIRIWVQLLEPAPIKFGRAKNVKNSARFQTTLDFGPLTKKF